jgi:hypothetical protein
MLSNTTQPTQDGGKSGDTMVLKELQRTDLLLVTSSMSVTEEDLLLRINKTRKLNQLLQLEILEKETDPNNGLSDMLITSEMNLSKRKVKEMLTLTSLL